MIMINIYFNVQRSPPPQFHCRGQSIPLNPELTKAAYMFPAYPFQMQEHEPPACPDHPLKAR